MSAAAHVRQRLRERSEEYLRLAAMEELRVRYPQETHAAYRRPGGLLWRHVFVPAYRRMPWSVKQQAMQRLGMTARGWTPPARAFGEPWRPPRPPDT